MDAVVVRVDRSKTLLEMLSDLNEWEIFRDEYDPSFEDGLPQGPEEVVLDFFGMMYHPDPDQLEMEYESWGFDPDPVATIQAIKDIPSLGADKQKLVVQWPHPSGKRCCVVFERFGGKKTVSVYWSAGGFHWMWRDSFAGRRRSS